MSKRVPAAIGLVSRAGASAAVAPSRSVVSARRPVAIVVGRVRRVTKSLPSRTSQTSNVMVRPLPMFSGRSPLPVVGAARLVAEDRTPGVVVPCGGGVGLALVALGWGDAVGARPSEPDRAGPHPASRTLAARQTAADRTATRRPRADGTEADGTEADGTEADGTEAHGTEANGTEADGTEADGTEANGTEADGTEADGT